MRKRIVTFITVALMVSSVFLASCSRAPKGHELTIIGMGDIHGQLDSYPSMADTDGDGVNDVEYEYEFNLQSKMLMPKFETNQITLWTWRRAVRRSRKI